MHKILKQLTRTSLLPVAMVLPILYLQNAGASEFDARQIMEQVKAQESPDNQIVNMNMILMNKKGQKRLRNVLWSVKTDDKDMRSSLIQFVKPVDVKGTGFLSVEKSLRDDDQWLYMPALRKIRRISSNDEQDNFMGSDLTYEDLKAEKLDKFDYKSLGMTQEDGEQVYKIEATPKKDFLDDTGYQRRIMYVRTQSLTYSKIEYFDKKGNLQKVLKGSGVMEFPEKKTWRLKQLEMENLSTGHKTILGFSNYKINTQEDLDHLFTRRNLERGVF